MKKDFSSVRGNKNVEGTANSEAGSGKSNAITIPQITLPKGGGALKGIDEKFSVNASNGTAGFSIPLPLTAGRNGFHPGLTLGYNSGSGNSAFGLGWNVDYPAVQRKADKKLPQYFDHDESDIFMFTGAEDLVPFLKDEGANWLPDEEMIEGFAIKRYRPRIEGGFSRIERIWPIGEDSFYWKVTTRDNVVTFFGKTDSYRLTDPANPSRIYQWLPELSFDDKGNCLLFEYKKENAENIENIISEKNRLNGHAKFTNLYLKRIRYSNIQPFYPDYSFSQNIYRTPAPISAEYLFEAVFDYGEHANDDFNETNTWPSRMDPFSNYRSGFEIRTYRLCKRVLMFHHFTNREFGLADNDQRVPYLVRSLDFEYSSSSENTPEQSELTYLASIKQTGYKKTGNGYETKSLPPIEFSYQILKWNTNEIKAISAENIIHAPIGLSNNYHWVDLYNEGIPGILSEQANAWYYKSNLGNAGFSNARLVSPKPSFSGLLSGALQLQDLDADGSKQIVSSIPGLSGFFELSDDNEWNEFKTFNNLPIINWQSDYTRMIDLNGDGKADVLITEDNVLNWYPSAGRKGYEARETVTKPNDEEKGPAIVFADEKQTIFLADMCGDGLTDIVRIRNGEISYWPNQGYGEFGAKITMDNAPLFDTS